MWIRPTPHIYNYNRDISSFQSSALSASSASASSSASSATCRSMRASSEAAVDRCSTSQMVRASSRATSVAPEAGTSLTGYTGFYGRQLALMKEAEAARRVEASAASSASASKSALAVKASSSAEASKKSVSSSVKSTSVKKSTSVAETTSVQAAKSVTFDAQLRQKQSLVEGRQSASRAVRRAEYHAETSGRDPRHVGVPRDITDDICKKVADIHMAPFEGREIAAARSALSQGKLKIDKMEKELAAITTSAMKYHSVYLKSARQMASEAMMAAEAEEKSSSKKVRKTIVESSSRSQVAAA